LSAAPLPTRRLGIWLIGARGAIATCVAYGLTGLRQSLIEPLGLVTEGPLRELPCVPLDQIVLGGHEVVRRGVSQTAAELSSAGVLPRDLVACAAQDIAAYDSRVRPGILDGPDVGMADLDPRAASLGALPPREQIEQLRADLLEFKEAQSLDRVVVVELASTEAFREEAPEWSCLADLEAALDAGRAQPASIIYAYAALGAGMPFVNFTPNRGACAPALQELALERGVPHCGSDGKTGETLVKTVLAPMFVARNLKVLSWAGYNMLGNRDGEVLADPVHRVEAVTRTRRCVRSSRTRTRTPTSESTTCHRSETGRPPGTSSTSRASWELA